MHSLQTTPLNPMDGLLLVTHGILVLGAIGIALSLTPWRCVGCTGAAVGLVDRLGGGDPALGERAR